MCDCCVLSGGNNHVVLQKLPTTSQARNSRCSKSVLTFWSSSELSSKPIGYLYLITLELWLTLSPFAYLTRQPFCTNNHVKISTCSLTKNTSIYPMQYRELKLSVNWTRPTTSCNSVSLWKIYECRVIPNFTSKIISQNFCQAQDWNPGLSPEFNVLNFRHGGLLLILNTSLQIVVV